MEYMVKILMHITDLRLTLELFEKKQIISIKTILP